jgi:hypothetical protein
MQTVVLNIERKVHGGPKKRGVGAEMPAPLFWNILSYPIAEKTIIFFDFSTLHQTHPAKFSFL